MLKELFDAVVNLGRESESVKCVPSYDPRKRLYDVKGEIIEHDKAPDFCDAIVHDLPSFIKAAALSSDENASIWLGDGELVLILDDEYRRDKFTLPLVVSDHFGTLESLTRRPALDHEDIMELLRHQLRDILNVDLVSKLATIKTNRKGDGTSTLVHGSQSMGNAVEAELIGAKDIPETVIAQCSVWQNWGLRFPVDIRLSMVIDVNSAKFHLRPLPDELDIAIDNARKEVAEELKKALPEIPVYSGRPVKEVA